MYFVEYIRDNEWVRYSQHRNVEWAEVNYETLTDMGRTARIIHEGKVIQRGVDGMGCEIID